jgi:hypothetical protein
MGSDRGFIYTIFGLGASHIAFMRTTACSHSRAQSLPLKGSSKGQSYPEYWLESVLRNYANSEAFAAGGQTPQCQSNRNKPRGEAALRARD